MTATIDLPKDEWTMVSSVSVLFQVQGQADNVFITEAGSKPTDESNRKFAIPGEMYEFNRVDGDFWAYAQGGTAKISIDPKA